MEQKEAVVIVKNLVIGIGIPKICVSITGRTEEEIYNQAKKIKEERADIAEWRMDYCEKDFLFSKSKEIIRNIVEILDTIPVIATFRTKDEGGEQQIEQLCYIKLKKKLMMESKADLIDIELSTGEAIVKELIEYAHCYGKKVIVSNHDFHCTPSKTEIKERIDKMQKAGADIAKIAVMPKTGRDVLDLLEATMEVKKKEIRIPVITMAMGNLGKVSRISGEIFGSAVTFGSIGEPSAPGQIEIHCLKQMLDVLH